MRVVLTVSFDDSDPLNYTVRRLTYRGEKSAKGMRRAASRYAQLVEAAPAPNANVMRELAQVVLEIDPSIVGKLTYPMPSQLIALIDKAAVTEERANVMKRYIERLNFLEFAKLIEAIEQMYVGK